MVVVVATLAFVSHGQQSVSQRVLSPTYMQCILLYFVRLLLFVVFAVVLLAIPEVFSTKYYAKKLESFL